MCLSRSTSTRPWTQAIQKKSLEQLLPISSLCSQIASERLLAQSQGIELCYLASNVQV